MTNLHIINTLLRELDVLGETRSDTLEAGKIMFVPASTDESESEVVIQLTTRMISNLGRVNTPLNESLAKSLGPLVLKELNKGATHFVTTMGDASCTGSMALTFAREDNFLVLTDVKHSIKVTDYKPLCYFINGAQFQEIYTRWHLVEDLVKEQIEKQVIDKFCNYETLKTLKIEMKQDKISKSLDAIRQASSALIENIDKRISFLKKLQQMNVLPADSEGSEDGQTVTYFDKKYDAITCKCKELHDLYVGVVKQTVCRPDIIGTPVMDNIIYITNMAQKYVDYAHYKSMSYGDSMKYAKKSVINETHYDGLDAGIKDLLRYNDQLKAIEDLSVCVLA